jgi:hypothetical protein
LERFTPAIQTAAAAPAKITSKIGTDSESNTLLLLVPMLEGLYY